MRYFLNVPTSTSDVLIDPHRWADLATAGPIPDGTRGGIGFDGSHSRDGTALVVADEEGHVELALLIERDPSDPPEWTVPRQLVHDTLAELFDRFDVVRMLCDPFLWRSELDLWARTYGDGIVVEQPTNSIRRFGPAVDRFRVAVAEGTVSHNGDEDLAHHLANARLVRGPGRASDGGHALYTLEKAGRGRLIDAAVAACLALQAIGTAEPVKVEPESFFSWG
jgi:phage terminase large subunit-like protein